MTRLDINRDELSADQANYDIFGRSLRDGLREFDFQTYLMPISDRNGFHIDFPELPRNMTLTSTDDYKNYIARLNGFPNYAAGHIELMREGVKQGITVPNVIMQRYNEPIEAQIVDDPEKSLLYKPLLDFPESVPESVRDGLRAATAKGHSRKHCADLQAVSGVHEI